MIYIITQDYQQVVPRDDRMYKCPDILPSYLIKQKLFEYVKQKLVYATTYIFQKVKRTMAGVFCKLSLARNAHNRKRSTVLM